MHSNLWELEVVTVMLTGLPLDVQLLSNSFGSLRLRGKQTERDGENSHGHIRAKAFHPAPQHEGHKRKKGSPLLCVSLSLQKSSSGSGTSQGRCRWADTPELCLQCRCAFTRSHTDGSLCVFLCVRAFMPGWFCILSAGESQSVCGVMKGSSRWFGGSMTESL